MHFCLSLCHHWLHCLSVWSLSPTESRDDTCHISFLKSRVLRSCFACCDIFYFCSVLSLFLWCFTYVLFLFPVSLSLISPHVCYLRVIACTSSSVFKQSLFFGCEIVVFWEFLHLSVLVFFLIRLLWPFLPNMANHFSYMLLTGRTCMLLQCQCKRCVVVTGNNPLLTIAQS